MSFEDLPFRQKIVDGSNNVDAQFYWGFPGIVIHQGAGYAQKGTTAYLDRPDLYYGDNEEDYYWIEQAIIDSNSTARVSIDLSGLAKNSKIWDDAIGLLK